MSHRFKLPNGRTHIEFTDALPAVNNTPDRGQQKSQHGHEPKDLTQLILILIFFDLKFHGKYWPVLSGDNSISIIVERIFLKRKDPRAQQDQQLNFFKMNITPNFFKNMSLNFRQKLKEKLEEHAKVENFENRIENKIGSNFTNRTGSFSHFRKNNDSF